MNTLLFTVAVQTAAFITLSTVEGVVHICKKRNTVFVSLQTLMTVSIKLVKMVVLVWMESTISRVAASRGILGVTAREVCRFN